MKNKHKNKKYLIIIHNSVWQIINSLECLHLDNISTSDALFIVLTQKDSKSAQQIQFFEERQGLELVYIFYSNATISKILKYAIIFKYLCRKKFDRVFVSQLNIPWISFILNIISYRLLCFFDEGFHSLKLEKLESEPIYEYRVKRLNLPISKRRIDLIYTSFNLQNLKLITRNITYLRIRSLLREGASSNGTYFIGQHVYKHYMTSEEYITKLKTVFRNTPDEVIYYYPHRHDDPLLLLNIEEIGFKVCKNDLAVEYFFIQSNIVPKNIIGFLSSALLSLKKIYGDKTSVGYIEINCQNQPRDTAFLIHRIYEEFKSENVLRIDHL